MFAVAFMLATALSTENAMALTLPAIFTDHMVLQRGRPVPIWGKASPGETVTVRFGRQTVNARAEADGDWRVNLSPLQVGEDGELTITAGSSTRVLRDVVVGDVWLCSGQSNMQWSVADSMNPAEEIAQANHPRIRLFQVEAVRADTEHVGDVPQATGWSVCSPRSVPRFSAVAYFMGRDLHLNGGVPIGIINTSWGGTPAEAWTSEAYLLKDPVTRPIWDRFVQQRENFDEAQEAWLAKHKGRDANGILVDPGNAGEPKGWAKPDFDDSAWKSMPLPTMWERVGLDIDGAVWFRTTVTIPEEWAFRDLELSLGPIDDYDVTYYEGVKVGSTGAEAGTPWNIPRVYRVPGSLVKAGRATISVRVFDLLGGGGICGRAEQMHLSLAGKPQEVLPLNGPWRYEVEYGVPTPEPRPLGTQDPNAPTSLFRTMIRPLAPFAIRGAAWYQGESNAWRAFQYRTLLPLMIQNWRDLWGQGDFPFLIVQLANFTPRAADPGESDWAELREAQTLTARTVANTAVALAIDIGEADDIHPRNKQEVGRRLAMAARDLDPSLTGPRGRSPLYRSMKVEGSAIRIGFHFAEALKTSDGRSPVGFQICGEDRSWVWAEARVDGAEVVVSSPKVPKPVAVRYGWANNPEVNLVDRSGLPVSPFRTDTWPGVTDRNR